MRAMVIREFGGSEKLKLEQLPSPVAAEDEVLIRVAYAGVNPVDWKIREGFLKEALPHQFPIVLGWDVSGMIASVGAKVNGWMRGDRVFAYARKPEVQWGTYAEYVAVKAVNIARAPENLTLAEAAAVPLAALTAWQSLFDFAGLKKGESVLIQGGAGGVGSYAIQFAKEKGAKVFATAGSSNQGYVKELGAEFPIDYVQDSVATTLARLEPGGVDVVFDCVGGDTLKESYPLVKPGGRLVSIVDTPDLALASSRQLKSAWVFVAPNGTELEEISKLFTENKVRPPALEEMKLEDAREALLKSATHRTRGKIVLKV